MGGMGDIEKRIKKLRKLRRRRIKDAVRRVNAMFDTKKELLRKYGADRPKSRSASEMAGRIVEFRKKYYKRLGVRNPLKRAEREAEKWLESLMR